MLVVETIAKIRRRHFGEGASVRSIARDLGVSRNTVRKVVRGGATEHRYDRSSAQPRPKLDGYLDVLEGLLEANAKRKSRDRLTLKAIWRRLCDRGCEAGYEAVRRYARQWAAQRGGGLAGAHVPLVFDPGEAFQFDWSHELVLLAGMPVTVKAAQFTLCYSRMPFVRCYPRETQEMVFDAHDRAFASFGGLCGRGIYDNMTTAVKRVLLGRDREINPRFERLCSHYLITPEFCTPRAGWEKGRVERQIATLRDVLFKPRPAGETLDCLNGQLAQRCMSHARDHPHPDFPEMSIFEVFACEEQRCLVPGIAPFRGHASHPTTASKTCLVRYDNNKYSVEARAAGRPVEVRALADRVEIRLDGEVVGSHARDFRRNRVAYDVRHYIPVLERKPGAIRNGAPFRAEHLPAPLARVREHLDGRDDGGADMVRILLGARDHGLEAVAAACTEALEAGVCNADVILNILSRRCQPSPAGDVATPAGLELRSEPAADCARYDMLLDGRDSG